MKKILVLILALSLIFVLCACGESTVEPTNVYSKTDASPLAFKVGLICLHDENSSYDANFINSFKEVCKAKNVDYLVKTGVEEGSACYDAAAELVDEGCKLIFADSFGHEDYMIKAAIDFPDVQFCHATGTKAHTQGLSNFHNAFAAIYEGRYLAGVAAGMKLNELLAENPNAKPLVGYVGAYSYAEVISGYSSFYLGVKSIVPDVKMQVIFTGSWYDETAEKEAANRLIDSGCIVISAHADSMGMPNACQTAGVPFVAYNGSFMAPCPDTYIVSTKINWAPYYDYCINAVASGDNIPADWTGTFATGSVQMCEINEVVAPANLTATFAALQEQFANGSLKVFDTSNFTVDKEVVTSYLADVDSDEGYTGDTEVVIDGYFHESEFRSAPYFDLNIDGITLLNTAF